MRPVTNAEGALISLVWKLREADKKLRAHAVANMDKKLVKLIDEYITSVLQFPDFDVEQTFMQVWEIEREKRDKAVAEIMQRIREVD